MKVKYFNEATEEMKLHFFLCLMLRHNKKVFQIHEKSLPEKVDGLGGYFKTADYKHDTDYLIRKTIDKSDIFSQYESQTASSNTEEVFSENDLQTNIQQCKEFYNANRSKIEELRKFVYKNYPNVGNIIDKNDLGRYEAVNKYIKDFLKNSTTIDCDEGTKPGFISPSHDAKIQCADLH